MKEVDLDLRGASLWPSIQGVLSDRIGFAEYHAAGSKNASFMIRENHMKLIHHVGMPPQLFDLNNYLDEFKDLGQSKEDLKIRENLK